MKYCTECGHKFAAKHKFCADCGGARIAATDTSDIADTEFNIQELIVPASQSEVSPERLLTDTTAPSVTLAPAKGFQFAASAIAGVSVFFGAVAIMVSTSPPSTIETQIATNNKHVELDDERDLVLAGAAPDEMNMGAIQPEKTSKPALESKPVLKIKEPSVIQPAPTLEAKTDETPAPYKTYYAEPGNTLEAALEHVVEAPVIPVTADTPARAEIQTQIQTVAPLQVESAQTANVQSLSIEQGDYVGQVAGGVPHGTGRLNSPEGYTYEGAWAHGAMTGRGVLETTYDFDGSWERYEGEFLQGFFHGRGTKTASSGNVQSGLWVKGYMHGQGESKFHFRDGTFSEYSGMFEDGVYHGYGQLLTRSGEIVIGRFANGMMPTDISPELKAAATAPITMVSTEGATQTP